MPEAAAREKPTPRNRVFLVHGRNHLARDAVRVFLQSLALEVVGWSDAVRLTGVPTPTTLDVVAAGIRGSDATVIVLSPDEVSVVVGWLGGGDTQYQPRPNVIFELGYAIAALGLDRVIILAAGSADLLSDIDGLNYVALSNLSDGRIDIRNRLSSAGLHVNSSNAYLDPAVAGDFSTIIREELVEDEAARSIPQLTQFWVDTALSLQLDENKLLEDIRNAIVEANVNRVLDLKYHYVGVRLAENWKRVCAEPGYGHAELVQATTASITPLLEKCGLLGERLRVVSLGPGDGGFDVSVMAEMTSSRAKAAVDSYIPVDISSDLLRETVKSIHKAFDSGLLERFPIRAIHTDFENSLATLVPVLDLPAEDSPPKVILVTGFTFGNSFEDHVSQQIIEIMNDEDVLIIDVRCHDISAERLRSFGRNQLQDEADIGALRRPYSSKAVNEFAFGPIALGTDYRVRVEDCKFDQEFRVQGTSAVNNAINCYITCSGIQAKLSQEPSFPDRVAWRLGRLKKRDTVRLAVVTYYDFEELQQWFVNKGLDVVHAKRNNGFGILGLKRIR